MDQRGRKMYQEILNLLDHCIAEENYSDAAELIAKTYELNIEVDERFFYYAAIVAESKGLYGLSLYFIRRGLDINNQNEQLLEYWNIMSNQKEAIYDWSWIHNRQLLANYRKLRIIIVTGFYETLDLFLMNFIESYRLLGHEVCVLNAREFDFEVLKEFITRKVDFIFSFNNGVFLKLSEDSLLTDFAKGKVGSMMVDHPLCTYYDFYQYLGENVTEFLVDKNHAAYLNLKYSQNEIKSKNLFLPHGGIPLNLGIKPLEERSIDVLYVGATKKYPMMGEDIQDLCVNAMIANPNSVSKDVVDAVLSYLKDNLNDGKEIELSERDYDALVSTEIIALGHYRTLAVKMLVESGVRVHVYGSGWDSAGIDSENLIIHGLVSPEECLEQMYDAKIVLNSMPWFKDGSHERLFNAMLAGSVCVTDDSKWIHENFVNGENIFIYNLEKMSEMVSQVKDILSEPAKYQGVADAGYKEAVAKHTWSHRALAILEEMTCE